MTDSKVLLVALNNTNVNNFTRALHYRNSMKCKSRKTPISTSERTFTNEFPNEATTIRRIKQNQKRHFTDNEATQMVIDYTQHRLTVYQLADKYGCHRQTISNVLKKNGATVTKRRMDEATITKAKQLYADGLTLKQVGQELSICESTIRKTLIKAGVEMRVACRYRRAFA
ncbi:MAG: hypothetical protein LBK67_11160 [Coriobacteriales bacterium]|nr:hypothetical protein [Coriobacteriales bacterium]